MDELVAAMAAVVLAAIMLVSGGLYIDSIQAAATPSTHMALVLRPDPAIRQSSVVPPR